MKRLVQILFFLAVCLVCGVVLMKCNNPVRTYWEKKKVAHAAVVAVNQVGEIKGHMNDTAVHYRDMYNREHAEKLLIQGNAAQIELFYKQREDSLAKVLKIARRQIQGMYGARTVVSGSFTTAVDEIPTFKVDEAGNGGSPVVTDITSIRHFEYQDSFLMEEGWVSDSSAMVNYRVLVPVTITSYWKRSWWLGRKKYYVDGYSDNPNVRISGLEGVQIKP